MSNSGASSFVPNLNNLSAPAIPENEQIHLPMNPVPTFDSENNDPQGNNEPEGRRRGRPPGSKNKPKAEKDSTMHSIALQVPHGVDLIEWVTCYAHSRETNIIILGGHGLISDVTLSHMRSQSLQRFSEQLVLTSLSGTYVLPSSAHRRSYFKAMLIRENCFMVNGEAQRMITQGPVVLIVSLYKNLIEGSQA